MKLNPKWIQGFIEAEGCFYISLSQSPRLLFKVAQHVKNVQVLYALKTYFGVGIVKKQRKDGRVWEYQVSKFEHLHTILLPFFASQTFWTSKENDYILFCQACQILAAKEHLQPEGREKLRLLKEAMRTD